MMKFLILSDIHGSFQDLERTLKAAESFSWDRLIICGDYLNHGPRNSIPEGYDPKACAEILNSFKEKIISVRGNCDSEVDQMLLDFPVLESSARIFIPRERTSGTEAPSPVTEIFIHHGHLFSKEDLINRSVPGTVFIQGHTHIPVLKEEKGFLFFNPGSISIPKTPEGKTFGTMEVKDGKLLFRLKTPDGKILKELEFSR